MFTQCRPDVPVSGAERAAERRRFSSRVGRLRSVAATRVDTGQRAAESREEGDSPCGRSAARARGTRGESQLVAVGTVA